MHEELKRLLEIRGVDSALEFKNGEVIAYETNGRNFTETEAQEAAKQLSEATRKIVEVYDSSPSNDQFNFYKKVFSPPKGWMFYAGDWAVLVIIGETTRAVLLNHYDENYKNIDYVGLYEALGRPA